MWPDSVSESCPPLVFVGRGQAGTDVQVTSHGEHWLRHDTAVAFKRTEIPWLDRGVWQVKSISAQAALP